MKEDKKLQEGGAEGTYPPAKMICWHDICQQNDIFMYELERDGISLTHALAVKLELIGRIKGMVSWFQPLFHESLVLGWNSLMMN